MVPVTEQPGLETVPNLYRMYYANDKPLQAEWVVEGTDSNIYVVPAEPGGWLRRHDYQGQIEALRAVSQEKARSLCWVAYGDVGRVTMAGANLEPLASIEAAGQWPFEGEELS